MYRDNVFVYLWTNEKTKTFEFDKQNKNPNAYTEGHKS